MADSEPHYPDFRRLDAVRDRLVAAARLTRTQAAAVRAEYVAPTGETEATSGPPPDGSSAEHWRAVLPEVGGYIGGRSWSGRSSCCSAHAGTRFSRALQIALFAVPAAVLITAALVIALTAGDWTPAGGAPAARRRVVAVLLVVAAAPGAAVAAVIAGLDCADRAALTTLIATGGLVGYVQTRTVGLLVIGVLALATVVLRPARL